MAGSGLLSVDPEQPIFGNILPRAAFYGFKGSLRTGQIPRFRQCDAKAGIDFIGVDRSLLQSQPVKRCRLRIIAIAKIDRKSEVWGKSVSVRVDLDVGTIIKKQK